MKSIGNIFIGLIVLFLLLGPFRQPILDGIEGWRTNDTTESFVVTTAGGITTANVTLAYDLYQAATSEVSEFTSNATETPVASSYDEDTQKLLVAALNESTTRTLTVTYLAETDDTVMQVLGPFLGFFIFGGTAFAVIWGMWHQGGRRRG